MAFDSLSDRLGGIFKRLKSKGKLSEQDIKTVMREIRIALLEADVSYKVVKEFVSRVSEKAVGEEVMESLTPAQQVIKIVNEELTAIMGGKNDRIKFASKPPTIVMLCGLQGAGKTTHCAKLALYFKNLNKRPLLVACDIYRPAAIKQLEVLGEKISVPVFTMPEGTSPVEIARKAVGYARDHGLDMVFLDTAGRLHIDEVLMEELQNIKNTVEPDEILLTIDSMTGQDAVNIAESFNNALGITGCILTKTDGDTRGGAALSVKFVTDRPIKFMGVGEKLGDLEPFHPDRMASRILGMGDMLSLIEKAEKAYDEKQAKKLEEKIMANKFDLDDFLESMEQLKGMGNLEQMLSMMPGVNKNAIKDINLDEKQINRTQAIIQSMTARERANPDILNASRRKRIAAGAGVTVEAVNKLMKGFEQSKEMMKKMPGMGGGFRKKKKKKR